jgi:hypothetical protein
MVKSQRPCEDSPFALRLGLHRNAIRYLTAKEEIGDKTAPFQNALIISTLQKFANFTNFGRNQDYF